MSDTPKYNLPPAEIEAEARRLIGDGKEEAFLKLLRANPGLARSDGEWRAEFPRKDPLLYFAVNEMTKDDTVVQVASDVDDLTDWADGEVTQRFGPATIKALLDKGATPADLSGDESDTAINRLLNNKASELSVKLLELFLNHPKLNLGAVISAQRVPIGYVSHFLEPALPPEWDERRRTLIHRLIERTDDKTVAQQNGLFFYIIRKDPKPSQPNMDFLIKALVNRGLPVEGMHYRTGPVGTLPVNRLLDKHNHQTVSMFLAAGMDENNPIDDDDPNITETIGELIDKYDRKRGTDIRKAARGMLEKELKECESGKVTPRELLFTTHGTTWQAQGLVQQGMLAPLFEQPERYHTGTLEERFALLQELNAALPNRMRWNDTSCMVRNEPLARPSTAVTVGYIRGGAEVTKGGVA